MTNSEEQGKLASAVENQVYDYMIKTNWKMEDVLKKVRVELKYV